MSTVLSKSFVDNNANVNEDQAMEMIVRATQKIKELEDERNGDEKLTAAKQIAKDLSAGYSSAIKYEKAKISFLLEKLEEIQNDEVNPTSSAKR